MPNPTTAVPQLTLARPDDWHLHLRDGPAMAAVLAATAAVFGRAIVMPNLRPPVTTAAAARAYRQRILDALISYRWHGKDRPNDTLQLANALEAWAQLVNLAGSSRTSG